MNCEKFIEEQMAAIKDTVGDGDAINALSGGVDSSVVTMLGHRAIGDQLKSVFLDDGLMRQDEPQSVADAFKALGVTVDLCWLQPCFQ